MNRYICLLLLYFVTFSIRGQEVKIIEKEKVNWSDYAVKVYKNQKEKIFKKPYKRLDSIDIFKIKYLSNGLKIEAFAAIPKKKKKYPVIVFNRGGNRNFNALGLFRSRENKGIGVVSYFSYLASKGYVVIGCNYRGGGNSEGKDQFGGEDVNDVLALLDVVKELPNVAADKIGLLGWSRGGMMAYKVLTQTNKIKTAALTKRSAIKWVNKFPKNVPIFLLHGSADWNVRATQSLELALEFQKYKIPYRLKIYEGGNHGISQFRKEKFKDIIGWFNKYLKKNTPLPNTNLINPYKKK
ncbi:alpha/beta hydrolase family protein [Tenacibaculum maritimum]|uniref:alpha/beta hydrolase family protein n=1 Tax=Tenacibaculum maritimum TaxID=107401 RepID=UPI001E33CE32|nr:prolyl oligopeptidase family serine peptidase [Tenacibaculum maritimum]MCD9621632.1 prolyl oligopeptidase family serine peptidase [Tenacibaculum maritimum]MCD9626801.1 prolyl oligopeptidase family serine peptidase [Tenacibaculum maritimum]MCD9630501.1 prolyl oligopeptidase family serine peptidase [Tenacibaculum maritimum]MCD9633769.1 prolyl oligopeptidase family serine peptidase [Tenacibaculum maritimum]